MMVASWDEIRGKIKHAYDEIDSAYQKHVVSAVDRVKERPLLNTAVKMALPAIPIIGPILRNLYDNIGEGGTKSDEDKTKQILEFLSKLEQQNKEQFYRIVRDLETNRRAIIDAVNDNSIAITDLISRSTAELLEAVGKVKEETSIIRVGVKRIETLLEKERPAPSEFKRPPKPSTFRGESNIFVGRKDDITKIKQYLTESKNAPVSIIGEEGLGKSALAFKVIHECQDMFDVIIPIYFESVLTIHSFLLEMAKSVQLPMTISQFEQVDNIEEKAQTIMDALAKYRKVLIYADNYEAIRNSIIMVNKSSTTQQSRQGEEDAIKINNFLKDVPKTKATYVLLTSTQRRNLTGERTIPLEGLSVQEGYDLFIEVAGDKLSKKIPIEMKEAIEEISRKTGGHPLSIEILASTYAEDLLPELRGMLKNLGAGVVNPEETEDSRHRSLEASFEYSITKLPEAHKLLLPELAMMFKSPFPASAVEYIFGSGDESARRTATAASIIRDLHNFSLLRRIDFDDHGDIEGKFRLYHFHPSVRNYLEYEVQQKENTKQQELEEEYGDQFSLYYYKLLQEIFNAIGTKDHVLSLEYFSVIGQGKDNDFDRAIKLTKYRLLASSISSVLGLILYTLGRYSAALEYLKKALKIDEQLQDRVGMARDYTNIGAVFYRMGNSDQALQYHNKALTIHKELQDRVGMARGYNNIGLVFYSQVSYKEALECYNESLAIDEELQDRVGMAVDYTNIGNVLLNQGNFEKALDHHKEALKIHKELQDRVGMAVDYTNIGIILSNQGNSDQALQYHNKALTIHKELQDRVGMARDYAGIGIALSGDSDLAIQSFSKGLGILQEFEENSGYHHPLRDTIQGYISELQKMTRTSAN